MIEEVEHKPPEVVEFQTLQVTVRNHHVKNLQAKVFLDDGGVWFDPKYACYLSWGGRRMFISRRIKDQIEYGWPTRLET